MTQNLLKINLPKWPQMIVTGVDVTKEQAREIILRTDSFLTNACEWCGGNNHEFNQQYRSLVGLTGLDYKDNEPIMKALNVIDCNYVYNRWASSSFIYGPAGWCSQEGKIAFFHNVGKWPTVEEVLDDWILISAAFPFLDLNVTLMNGESCDETKTPLVNIRVVNGTAELMQPDLSVHSEVPDGYFDFKFTNVLRELGLEPEFYDWAIPIVKTATTLYRNTTEFKEKRNNQ
ncbi:MAG: hypothetical protein ACRC3J_05105 [Culicoidibacterales bacterium]